MSDKPKLLVRTGPFKDVIVLGHASVDDFDREAGRVGSCVEEADYSVIYRDTLPEIHEAVIKDIEALSGVPRGVNAEATAKAKAAAKEGAKVSNVLENPVPYFNRVKAAVTEDIWKEVDAKFREHALATVVDASPSKRNGAASKANLEKADEVLLRTPDAIEAAVTKMLSLVPTFDLTRDAENKPDRVSLARLVGAFIDAQKSSV